MKSICFCITQAELGGAQVYVRDLVQAAKQAEHQVMLAHGEQSHDWLDDQAMLLGIPIHFLKHIHRAIRPVEELRGFLELYKFFKKNKFDTVFLNSSKIGILGIPAARLARVPTILFNPHGWAYDDPRPWWERLVYILAYLLTTPLVTSLICVSEYTRQSGIRHGLPQKKLKTIHNGIDTTELFYLSKSDARHYLTQTYSLPAVTYLIGTIANWYPTKGLLYLLTAIKIGFAAQTDTHFCLIGSGQQGAELNTFIEKNNLQAKVTLISDLKPAAKYLKAFDLLALPSVREGYPYVLLEAMAAGLPIVATAVGGNPEALSNYPRTHYSLVPARDPKALSLQLQSLRPIPPLSGRDLSAVQTKIDISQMREATMVLL